MQLQKNLAALASLGGLPKPKAPEAPSHMKNTSTNNPCNFLYLYLFQLLEPFVIHYEVGVKSKEPHWYILPQQWWTMVHEHTTPLHGEMLA